MVNATDAPTLQGFVHRSTDVAAMVYTDEAAAYNGLRRPHAAVRHSVGEYVRDMAHTNGIESHWAMLKRGYIGTFHQRSEEHLGRYMQEFAGRHNARCLDTADQMARIAANSPGKLLTYTELIAPPETRNPRML